MKMLKIIRAYARTFLPFLMMKITGKERWQQPIWWRHDSIVHNAFMLWKLIFWARKGIRAENSVNNASGVATHKYYTWEALLFAAEEAILKFRFKIPARIHIPILQTPLGVIPASPYLFAIAFDTTGNTSGSSPTVSITRGTGASNYFGWVDLIPFGIARSSSGTTWAGVSMTQVFSQAYTPLSGTNGFHYGLYIVNPTSGTQNVTATTTSTYGIDATTFSGVDQSTPLDTNVDGASHNFVIATNASTTNFSVTGTTHVDNSFLTGITNYNISISSGGTNTTFNPSTYSGYSTAAITPAGSATLAYVGGPQAWFLSLSALQPAAAVGPANMKTWDGLAKASIKTMDGLAIASVKTWNGVT